VTIDPAKHDYNSIYKLMIGSIVPRPIAFVSSMSPEGVRNLAPFSFFNGVCSNPPTILFATTVRKDGSEKDTLNNIEATREFVVHIVSEPMAEAMNLCSAEVPPDIDEFTLSHLTPVPSDCVRPPRVKEALIAMECRLTQIVHINPHQPGGGNIVIGEILLFHIADELLDNFRVDPDKLMAIGRMGGPTYARTRDRFDLVRSKA
jgi:flavin reductase (DIM6/NTAB) family NADH-FMN oxidoreductase RutF